ncbi:hypothetical protein [Chamaesiphon sp. VAR_69_metabat_338]|nr:hypothetical protein [Chamaesiphon sp. VAR_69_metabat_338]
MKAVIKILNFIVTCRDRSGYRSRHQSWQQHSQTPIVSLLADSSSSS